MRRRLTVILIYCCITAVLIGGGITLYRRSRSTVYSPTSGDLRAAIYTAQQYLDALRNGNSKAALLQLWTYAGCERGELTHPNALKRIWLLHPEWHWLSVARVWRGNATFVKILVSPPSTLFGEEMLLTSSLELPHTDSDWRSYTSYRCDIIVIPLATPTGRRYYLPMVRNGHGRWKCMTFPDAVTHVVGADGSRMVSVPSPMRQPTRSDIRIKGRLKGD